MSVGAMFDLRHFAGYPRYPTERERHIARGVIVPLCDRPTLRLLPGERERFEAEARAGLPS